jgi:hypothetical protein
MTPRNPLILLPYELNDPSAEPIPSCRTVYIALLDCRTHAEWGDNGQQWVARADLPLTATTLCRPMSVPTITA